MVFCVVPAALCGEVEAGFFVSAVDGIHFFLCLSSSLHLLRRVSMSKHGGRGAPEPVKFASPNPWLTEEAPVFASALAHRCIGKLPALGRRGLPTAGEWTILAAFVLTRFEPDIESLSFHVVSVATGTKALGGKLMVQDGAVLHDGHAEVVARRGLLRLLYEQLTNDTAAHRDLFQVSDDGFLDLAPHVHLHFYVSQTPCMVPASLVFFFSM
jgi:hypothetical protein